MSYTKFAVKSTAIILVVSIFAAFMGYLVRVILARNLSVEEFGLFYAVFAFLGLLGIFKTLGFDRALAKFIPEFIHKEKNDFIKSSVIYAAFIQFATNSIIIIVVYLLSNFLAINFFNDIKAIIVLRLMAIAFFIDSFMLILKFAFQGFKQMLYFSFIDLIRMLLIVIITFVGLKLNYGLLSPIIAYIAVPLILLFIFGWLFVHDVFPEFFKARFIINKALIKKISHYSIFIMAITVGTMVLGYTDMIMLTYFLDLRSVALYSVALPTAKILFYFPIAIAAVLLPLASELWSKKRKEILREGLEALYKYSIVIILPLVLIIFSFADILINIFFGKDYISATNATKILSIGMIFATLNSVSGNFFSGIGKPQITSKIVYIAAIFNFISNLIFIPIMGINGAAITTTVSYFIMAIIGLINIKKFIIIRFPVKVWIKTLIAGIFFVFIIGVLKKLIILNIWLETAIVLIIAGITYVVFLFLLNAINIRELKDLYKRLI